ncbi:hypothetical protein JHK86_016187 [Glycine max]|nr:hypothetical protein JHK86_016187 [Glycine max]
MKDVQTSMSSISTLQDFNVFNHYIAQDFNCLKLLSVMVVIHLDDGDDIYDIEKTLIVALANSSRSSAKDKSTMAAEPLASSTWDHRKAILLEPLWASKFPSQYFMQLYIHDLNVKPMAKLEKKSYATYHAYSRKQDYGGAARQMAEQAAMSKQRALETAEWATS